MDTTEASENLGIADRISRTQGRHARNTMAAAKVTREERYELDAAARSEGKAFSEWAREVLLQKARSGSSDVAVLTELVALRMLTSTVLRSIATGQMLSPESFAQILSEVKTSKHEAAADVLRQYTKPQKER